MSTIVTKDGATEDGFVILRPAPWTLPNGELAERRLISVLAKMVKEVFIHNNSQTATEEESESGGPQQLMLDLGDMQAPARPKRLEARAIRKRRKEARIERIKKRIKRRKEKKAEQLRLF